MAYTILPYVSQGTDITSVRTNTIRDNFTWMKDNLVPLAVAAQHEKKVLSTAASCTRWVRRPLRRR